MVEPSDQQFIEALRAAVVAYLEAVDRWEAAYNSYYRMPGEALTLSPDMESAQHEYVARHRQLKSLLARARRLCLQHRIRNPLPGLLRVSLGRHAPQQRIESAISRTERNAVTDCLLELADVCSGFAPEPDPPDDDSHGRLGSILRGIPVPSWRSMAAGVLCMLLAILIVLRVGQKVTARPRFTPPRQQRMLVPPGPRTANARFYRIEERPMTPWGDYGHILQHGMTAHLDRTGGLLSLERTGPYMPPITFPGIGDVVLNAEGRRLLETSGLSGFSFQPVSKTRIVSLAWQEWDLNKSEPPEYPRSGEPEDYILDRRPDRRVADQMGDIWELVVPVTAKIGRPRDMVDSFRELYVEHDTWNGADIFRGRGYGSPLVTERARIWFEQYLGAYVQFEEFASK